ncbi:hypothetical protein [Allokutzneria sp. NRRL B-24872]|uniref:hypothetical protein n=1 Tax=Allokutzneria sp. NRRL B-24872 TaxID=1137961 RepID=UPI000A38BCDB|nr:hypothetical protein [Allokutzneria sp. NRRL B-24872]
MRRWRITVGIAIALVAVIVAVWATDWFGGAATRLRVTVTGLPEGVSAAVTVVGPVSYTVTGPTDERTVPAGTYVVRIDPVATELGKAHPDSDTFAVTVPTGETATADAEYVTVIPDSTTVLDHTNPGIASTAGTTVTFAAGAPALARLRPGSVFIVAEGPQTPDPMARRVLSVNGTVVETTPVPLSEALPAGRFRLADNGESLGFRPIAEPPMLSVNFGEMLASKGTGRCAAGGTRGVMDVHNLRPKFSGDFDWGLFPPKAKIDVTATLNPKVTFQAELAGAVECQVKVENTAGLKWLNNLCGKVVGRFVKVGPVSLKCKVRPFVGAEARATAGTKMGFDATLHAGIKNSDETLTMSDPHGYTPVQKVLKGVEAKMSFQAKLGLEVGLYGGDPSGTAWLGLTLEASMGPELAISSTSAEASLLFGLALNGEIELDARFKDWKRAMKIASIERKWPVWQSNDITSFRKPPPPVTEIGTVYYDQYDESTYRNFLYSKSGDQPAKRLAEVRGAVSPDGSKQAWMDGSRLMVGAIGQQASALASGFDTHGLCSIPEWTPDSRAILFQHKQDRWAMVDVDSGRTTPLAGPTGCYPVMSPDGGSVAWYDASAPAARIRITDSDGSNSRFVPLIDGKPDPCANAVVALSPGGEQIVVDESRDDGRACGDGPSSGQASSGVLVDTTTGKSVPLSTGPVRSALFHEDGSVLVRPANKPEYVLLSPDRRVLSRLPMTDGVRVLAHVPG